MKKYSVYLVDDHELVTAGIGGIIEQHDNFVVEKSFKSAEELLNALNYDLPDLIISDISMPNKTGIEMAREIKIKYHQVKIILLTMHTTLDYVKPALQAGIDGYVLKDSSPAELIHAMNIVLTGEKYISPKANSALAKSFESEVVLTKREIDVLKLIANGKTSKEIADILIIAFHTVESHRKNMLAKTCCKASPELIKWAVERGIIQRSEM